MSLGPERPTLEELRDLVAAAVDDSSAYWPWTVSLDDDLIEILEDDPFSFLLQEMRGDMAEQFSEESEGAARVLYTWGNTDTGNADEHEALVRLVLAAISTALPASRIFDLNGQSVFVAGE